MCFGCCCRCVIIPPTKHPQKPIHSVRIFLIKLIICRFEYLYANLHISVCGSPLCANQRPIARDPFNILYSGLAGGAQSLLWLSSYYENVQMDCCLLWNVPLIGVNLINFGCQFLPLARQMCRLRTTTEWVRLQFCFWFFLDRLIAAPPRAVSPPPVTTELIPAPDQPDRSFKDL